MFKKFKITNKIVLLVIGSILSITNLLAQVPSEIQDPMVIGINKLPPRTFIWPSESIESSQKASYNNSD